MAILVDDMKPPPGPPIEDLFVVIGRCRNTWRHDIVSSSPWHVMYSNDLGFAKKYAHACQAYEEAILQLAGGPPEPPPTSIEEMAAWRDQEEKRHRIYCSHKHLYDPFGTNSAGARSYHVGSLSTNVIFVDPDLIDAQIERLRDDFNDD